MAASEAAGAGEGSGAARPGGGALRAAGPGAARTADGRLVVVDETKYYSSLFEEYVRPRLHQRTPEQEAAALRRTSRRLRVMNRWRIMPERKAFKPVAIPTPGLRLSLPEGRACAWCCCPFAPCPCLTSERPKPWRPVPRGGGRPEERDPEPPDAVERLRRAAAEGCLCPLRTPGLPLCPAEQLDFVCNRGLGADFEVRRGMRLLTENLARERGTFKEDFTREIGRYGQISVGTQTWENVDGSPMIGEGKVLYGRGALFGRRKKRAAAADGGGVGGGAGGGARGDAADGSTVVGVATASGAAAPLIPVSYGERIFDTLDGSRLEIDIVYPDPAAVACREKKRSWFRCWCRNDDPRR